MPQPITHTRQFGRQRKQLTIVANLFGKYQKIGVGYQTGQFDLEFPKNGLFVAYEKLLIESNKTGTKYQPYVLYNYVERDFFYTFSGGKWNKQTAEESTKLQLNEPAINLVLSN